MTRRRREPKPLTPRQRARIVAYLREKLAALDARRAQLDRLLAIYEDALNRMPHPGD